MTYYIATIIDNGAFISFDIDCDESETDEEAKLRVTRVAVSIRDGGVVPCNSGLVRIFPPSRILEVRVAPEPELLNLNEPRRQ